MRTGSRSGRLPAAGGVLSASGPGRVFVFLVVVALLFCHGAFGYAHQSPPAEAHVAHVAHVEGGHHPAPDRTADQTHSESAYFATLLALFFGTFLLLGGGVLASTRLRAPAAQNLVRRAEIFPPPRGPTPLSLQVFRL